MNRALAIFLQALIVLIGAGVLAFLLWEPHVEGVNANAAFWEVYLDPFIAYAYTASIAFFVALFQALTLLRYIGRNDVFSPDAVRALRTIKYCALIIIAFTAALEAYLLIVRPGDDIAGGVAMGLFVICTSLVIATAAAVFETVLRSAVDMKSEHDLTV